MQGAASHRRFYQRYPSKPDSRSEHRNVFRRGRSGTCPIASEFALRYNFSIGSRTAGRMAVTLPHRRQLLQFAAGAAALPAMLRIARAQAYPSRPVRWVVGFAPGGGYDTVARLIGQWLQERLGQPFVIENRPGAATNIATEAVVRAAPDGYTLLLIGSTNAINATFYPKLNFNFIHDIAPVAGITTQPQVMLGGPSLSSKTISEVIAYAKANPGKVNVASPAVWSRQSSRRRAVQVDGRCQSAKRAIRRQQSGADGIARWSSGDSVCFASLGGGIYWDRQSQRTWSDDQDALRCATRGPEHQRIRPGL